MYKRIMVPIDLAHVDALGKAITTAADLAKHYGSELTFVGMSGAEPSKVARFPKEYDEKLKAFAEAESVRTGAKIVADPVRDHDVAADLDAHLVKEAERLGADLIIMATHAPGRWVAHASNVARHAPVSVMLVRG